MVDTEAEFLDKLLKEHDKYDKRLWQKMPSARFSYWSKRELWTLLDFAYLMNGKEPLEKDTEKVDFIPSSFVTYVEDLSKQVMDATLLDKLCPIVPYTDANFLHCLLPPSAKCARSPARRATLPDEFVHLLDSNEPGTDVVENRTSPSMLPGYLCVIVDDVNQTVEFYSQEGNGEKTKGTRKDIVGRGTVTWDLLVAFAKCNGSLEGNVAADVKKINTSVNRKNLGEKLMIAMNLDESPIVEGRSGVMRFHSIQLAGGVSSTDAMGRQTCSYDDQGTEYLRRHGDDMSDID